MFLQHRGTAKTLREPTRLHAPGTSELIMDGILGFFRRERMHPRNYINPTKTGINLCVSRGVSSEDK